MSQCSRCGSAVDTDNKRTHHYCESCEAVFDEIRENGVTVRSRHGNREFERDPYDAPTYYADRHPQNQVEALACGKIKMERTDSRGVFIYQRRGSRWLIDEYLNAHPGIADDVQQEIELIRGTDDSGGGGLRDLLPI